MGLSFRVRGVVICAYLDLSQVWTILPLRMTVVHALVRGCAFFSGLQFFFGSVDASWIVLRVQSCGVITSGQRFSPASSQYDLQTLVKRQGILQRKTNFLGRYVHRPLISTHVFLGLGVVEIDKSFCIT